MTKREEDRIPDEGTEDTDTTDFLMRGETALRLMRSMAQLNAPVDRSVVNGEPVDAENGAVWEYVEAPEIMTHMSIRPDIMSDFVWSVPTCVGAHHDDDELKAAHRMLHDANIVIDMSALFYAYARHMNSREVWWTCEPYPQTASELKRLIAPFCVETMHKCP